MSSIINFIQNNVNRTIAYSILVFFVLVIIYVSVRIDYRIGILISLLPFLFLVLMAIIHYPFLGFSIIFIINYFISGFYRYVPSIPTGITMDFVTVVFFICLVMSNFNGSTRIKFNNIYNGLTLASFIWILYCLFQLLNPAAASTIAWFQSARGMGLYFFIIVCLASITLTKYFDLKRLLFIWAILCLIAVAKAYVQKTYGFDPAELRWLYNGGGGRTHLLVTGVRYFSFFTDAANFGTGIAFSGVIFGISSFYFKKPALKVFYLLTAAACGYGMLISGTRGSLAVPFVALTVFVFLSKNVKAMILTGIMIATSFYLLKNTNFGEWNVYIRRMRTAFNTEDPSFMVRVENQRKLRTYMWDKPFGAGIGMARQRSDNYQADKFLAKIPTDSWYVLIWVETGIVGLILHVLLLLYIVVHGAYLVLFRLKNREVKGVTTAMICGISGIYVASYSIEIFGQFPTGFILYTCMTFVFLSPIYDKELEDKKLQKVKEYETIT